MKTFISIFLILGLCCTLFVFPVSAQTQINQNDYSEAKEYIANIDFDYFYNSADVGDDMKEDLKRIQEFIATKQKYTI